MILRILTDCRGVDLRDVNGLILVLNVRMNGYFYALIGQALKGNNGRSGKYGCIKEKDNLNAAFRFSAIKATWEVTGLPSIRIGSPVFLFIKVPVMVYSFPGNRDE